MALKYHLQKHKPQKSFFKITMVADSNDADYITEVTKRNADEAQDLLKAIEIFLNINWSKFNHHALRKGLKALYNESPDDYYFILEEIEFPRDSWCEICHTLSSFRVEYFDTKGFVYDVLFDDMSAEMFN